MEEKRRLEAIEALKLNINLQENLYVYRERIESLLNVINVRIKENEERLNQNSKKCLSRLKGFGIRGAYLNGGTFYFKGNMFFKNIHCRNCPNNNDYEYRKYQMNEMFPMDYELHCRHVWSLMDKGGIIEGIKKQILSHLADAEKQSNYKLLDEKMKSIENYSKKLVDILPKVGPDFTIDWHEISAIHLNHRHSPEKCAAMWNVYLHPDLKRGPWTETENSRLNNAIAEFSAQNWKAIGKTVGKRSDYQCFIQYKTNTYFIHQPHLSKWTPYENGKLLELVEKNKINGIVNWKSICQYFPDKTKTAIQSRYAYSLDPNISHEPFTPEEDLIIMASVKEYGEKFNKFGRKLFPNRSVIQLRNRYQTTLKNRDKIEAWSIDDDQKLMEFVCQHGKTQWLQCSKLLGNHSRISCRTRFCTIKKFFDKYPNAELKDLPRRNKTMLRSLITPANWIEKVVELRENPEADLVPQKKQRLDLTQKKLKKNELKRQLELHNTSLKDLKISKLETRKKRTKSSYIKSLRSNGLKIYDFFKYSYDFHLGKEFYLNPLKISYALKAVGNSLNFHRHFQNYEIHIATPNSIKENIEKHFENIVIDKDIRLGCYCMPPSYPLLLCFRVLCLQSNCNETKNFVANDRTAENRIAINVFRQRLRILLYQTAILSRLNINIFENLTQNRMMKVHKIQTNS